MNIANKLTLLRVILIPFFIFTGLINNAGCQYAALVIFAVASFTDFLDGYLARKNNLVSDFGKFMDPLADKLLVMAAFSLLVHRGDISVWVFYIVILRELTITGIRLVAASKERVIQAAMSGKIKTVFQMAVIILALIPPVNNLLISFEIINMSLLDILMYIMIALTLISGAEYVVKNADVIKP